MGIQRGMDDARRAAVEIASASKVEANKPTDVVQSVLELNQAKQAVEASAKVVKTADEMIGTLLDDMA